MKSSYKVILIMVILLCLTPISQVYAETSVQYEDEADKLSDMSLFQGTNNGFELDKVSTRGQGAAMLVRLIGKEDEALSMDYELPFTDVPKWAKPYVGYLYTNHLTNGIGADLYGTDNPLRAKDYMTFVLRVLGYSDIGDTKDFTWDMSLEKAVSLGIISQKEKEQYATKTFIRDDMVHFSYQALYSTIKTTNQPLAIYLTEQKVIPVESIIGESAWYTYLTSDQLDQLTFQKAASNQEDLISNLLYMMHHMVDYKDMNVADYSGDLENELIEAIEMSMKRIEELRGYTSMVRTYSYGGTSNVISVGLTYDTTLQEVETARLKSQKILEGLHLQEKSVFDKIKAIHDYVVDHTVYDSNTASEIFEESDSYTLVGVFNNGSAVCSGYADAINYMCFLAGIPCIYVDGYVNHDPTKLHAWNIVELEGEYYQLDATWDDPVTTDGTNVLNYHYFNITDDEISADHTWIEEKYPSCDSDAMNYYVYNQRLFSSEQAFKDYINDAVNNGQTAIDVRISGFTTNYGAIKDILYSHNNVTGYSGYPIEDGYVSFNISYR